SSSRASATTAPARLNSTPRDQAWGEEFSRTSSNSARISGILSKAGMESADPNMVNIRCDRVKYLVDRYLDDVHERIPYEHTRRYSRAGECRLIPSHRAIGQNAVDRLRYRT